MTERDESAVLRTENEFLRKSMKEIGDSLEYMFATTDGKFYPHGVYEIWKIARGGKGEYEAAD